MEKPWIGLLDCNNFFVSCERLFRPDLAGKPVVVLSGNDGCIVARSQEVKDMAIPMGVPYFQVKDTLKKAETTVFSSHFALYRDISRRVFEVMREELSVVQQYSVDEAFFACETPDEALATRVKQAVETRVGIPVSVGIAPSKTLAKQVNSIAKKGKGVAIFDPAGWDELSTRTPLASIWGVGGRMEMQYKQHGIVSVADLLQADPNRVKQLFGINGLRLQSELKGQAVYTLSDTHEPQKSIMSSRSFKSNTTELAVVSDAVAYHIRHAMEDLRSMGMTTQVLRVSLQPSRHGDFVLQGSSAEVMLTSPSDDTVTIMQEAQKLTQSLFKPGVPYKKVGVVISFFTPKGVTQGNLFSEEIKASKTSALMSVIDALNKKNGKDMLVIGSRLKTSQWQSRVDLRSPGYTTRWPDISSVKAG